VLVRNLLSYLFSQPFILLLFFIYWKKEQEILFLFQFSFYYLLTMVFLFIMKKISKNCSYSIIFSLFRQFRLVIEYNKSEVFHFSKFTKNFNPSFLDLRPLGDVALKQKDSWCYLEFFFDRKLSFQYHTYYYTNKVLSTIKSMKMLRSSTRGLSLVYK